jgi:outer membrane lipoprotein LolB
MKVLGGLMLAMLAGCTTLMPVTSPSPPLVQAFIPSFEINGRLSVRHDNEGFSGNLRWRHVFGEDEFVVLSPLGQGVARVTQNAQGASLQTADGQMLYAEDAESLTQQALGFRLPLAGLPYWVQGQAASDAARLRHNDDGTVGGLSEQGWEIEYLSYQSVQNTTLPSKLSMQNTEQNTGLKLRLIIDDWQAPAP